MEDRNEPTPRHLRAAGFVLVKLGSYLMKLGSYLMWLARAKTRSAHVVREVMGVVFCCGICSIVWLLKHAVGQPSSLSSTLSGGVVGFLILGLVQNRRNTAHTEGRRRTEPADE